MRGALLVLLFLVGSAAAGAVGWGARDLRGPQTVTVTDVRTRTVVTTTEASGLPAAVATERAALLEAAAGGDYDRLRPLVTERVRYSFGGPFEGGAVAYWQGLEKTTGESPIRILADLLRLPYTLHRGIYTWPFAFDKQADELAPEDVALLRSVGGVDLSDDFGEGSGYLGWRVGIDADGTWVFFIAGD